jgi:hypothetical protein
MLWIPPLLHASSERLFRTSLCAEPTHRDADRGQNSARQVQEQQEDSIHGFTSVQVFLFASSTVSALTLFLG